MASIKAGKPKTKSNAPRPPSDKAGGRPPPSGGPPPGLDKEKKKKPATPSANVKTIPSLNKGSPPPALLPQSKATRRDREAEEINLLKKKNRLLREKILTSKDRVRREKDDNKKKGEFEAAKKKADKMAEKIAMYEKFTKSTLDDKRDILAKMMEGGQELIDLKTKAEDMEAKIEAQKSRIAKANKLTNQRQLRSARVGRRARQK